MKKCSKCKEYRSFTSFNKYKNTKDGLQSYCKDCQKHTNKVWHQNTDRKEYYRAYEKTHKNERKVYRAENRPQRRLYEKQFRANNINHKLSCNLRRRLNKAIRGQLKSGSAIADLGCTMEQLKTWIEQQFNGGMSWDNYGKIWHIDHIVPLSTFDLTDRKQFTKACHWFNLRPLLAVENIARRNKV